MPTPKSKLSKFILSLPATLTGGQVVARAKAEGMKTSGANVYRVRGLYSTPSKTGATNPASKTGAAKTTWASGSKAGFVRSHPTLSPKEVVAKAKAEGIQFGAQYVYRVRGLDKAAKKKRVAAKTTPGATRVNGVTRPAAAASSSAEDLLHAVAAELGLGRAVEILTGERARVQSILRR